MNYDLLTREELIEKLKAEQDARRALEVQHDDTAGAMRLLHELQVHQIELEVQNQALREAQGQLEESRSRYVDLYDFAPITYVTFDRNGVVLEINLTGASMLGKERLRIIGMPFTTLVRVVDPDGFLRHIRSSLEATIPVMAEIAFSTERGPLEAQLVSTAVPRPRGAPTLCRTAFLDITQRRLAERQAYSAHSSERAMRSRIESIDRASAAVTAALAKLSGPDIGGFLQVVVDQAREVVDAEYAGLGIGGQMGGKLEPWVFSGVSSEHAAAIGRTPSGVGILGTVIHAGRPVRVRDLREHGSFSGFPPHHPAITSFLGVPIHYLGESRGTFYLGNKNGAAEFSEADQMVIEMLADRVGTAMEVARLRQIDAREHTRLELLAKAGPILAEDNLLAAVSHVMRNDLAAVRMNVDALVQASCTDDRRSERMRVTAIKRAVTRMERLIGSLRDATMIATGQFTIEAKTEDVSLLVDEAFHTLELQAELASLQLKVQIESQLPPVRCDRERILQVIANLVGNAIKFTDKGGEIRIAAGLLEDSVCISVSDTGRGIPAQQLLSIFDRHGTGSSSTRHGTGLGLFISKGIVEAHGGRIWADSQLGIGTTFSFTLPVVSQSQ
jgi:PAS domain S-box-containing protein